MSQVVEVRELRSREEAELAEEDFRIDNVPVEIVEEADGTFTVRATYPDDVFIPRASGAQSPSAPGPRTPPSPPPPANNDAKKIGEKGAALIKAFESCLKPVADGFQAYIDPVGVLTIGWGHTNDNGRQFDSASVWTQDDCDAEFLSDMAIFESAVNDLVEVSINQDQFDALVSFAFNVGAGNLGKSTLLKKLNAGDFAGAAQEFQRWNKGGGKVLPGLTRRRACEALLFQSIPDKNYDGIPD